MLCPVMCFSCNKRVGGMWFDMQEHVSGGAPALQFFEQRGVTRLCCRRMLTTSVDLACTYASHDGSDAQPENVSVQSVASGVRSVVCS